MSLTLLEAAQAKLEGKRVEVGNDPLWVEWDGMHWPENLKYRIAPPPKKKMKYLCWATGVKLEWLIKETDNPLHWKRIPELDKEVEVPA